jgi:error-prone DNA polymerase
VMEVRGRVEYDEDVIHVITAHLTDATDSLHRLSQDLIRPEASDSFGDHSGHHGHPRNVRIVPNSRDFH